MYEVTVFYKEHTKDGWIDHKTVRRFKTEAEAIAWETGVKDGLDCDGYKLESQYKRDIEHGRNAFRETSISDIMDAYREYLANDKNWNY